MNWSKIPAQHLNDPAERSEYMRLKQELHKATAKRAR